MSKRRGFTLIELVVVILILGILAGVAAPRLFQASEEAADNGLKQTLTVVRDALELYAARNGGAAPPTGSVAAFHTALEPYLRGDFPICPVGPVAAQNNSVTFDTTVPTEGDTTPTTGWKYNENTNEFICNNPNQTASDNTVDYDQL